MSENTKRIRRTFPNLFSEEFVSVQPMSVESAVPFYVHFEDGCCQPYKHVPGDGVFCECWRRCPMCHPLKDELKEEP